jgi:hypothetical protein
MVTERTWATRIDAVDRGMQTAVMVARVLNSRGRADGVFVWSESEQCWSAAIAVPEIWAEHKRIKKLKAKRTAVGLLVSATAIITLVAIGKASQGANKQPRNSPHVDLAETQPQSSTGNDESSISDDARWIGDILSGRASGGNEDKTAKKFVIRTFARLGAVHSVLREDPTDQTVDFNRVSCIADDLAIKATRYRSAGLSPMNTSHYSLHGGPLDGAIARIIKDATGQCSVYIATRSHAIRNQWPLP